MKYSVLSKNCKIEEHKGAIPKSARAIDLKGKENYLTSLLVLFPNIFNLSTLLPLVISWPKSTYQAPDLMYIDEFGRLTIVELKAKEANNDTIAQVLGYGEHWRSVRFDQYDNWAYENDAHQAYTELLGEAYYQFTGKDINESRRLKIEEKYDLGAKQLKRLNPPWSKNRGSSLYKLAQATWGKHAFTMLGTAPRYIIVAPEFSQKSISFTKTLSKRCINIELVRVAVNKVATKNELIIIVDDIFKDRAKELIWNAFQEIWRIEKIRAHFLPMGLAEPTSGYAFSFINRKTPSVKFGIQYDKEEESLYIYTSIPDKWPNKEELRKKIMEASKFKYQTSGWIDNGYYHLPQDKNKLRKDAEAISRALVEHVINEAPNKLPIALRTGTF